MNAGDRKNVAVLAACAVCASFATSSVAVAAIKTWTGATNSNWNTATNWSASGVPTGGDDVFIVSPLAPGAPASRYSTSNDRANGSGLTSITFAASLVQNASVTGANTTNNRTDFGGTNAGIYSDSSFSASYDVFAAFSGNITIGGTGTGVLSVNASNTRNFGGTGGNTARSVLFQGSVPTRVGTIINKSGSNSGTPTVSVSVDKTNATDTVRFVGNNSYSGTTSINEGVALFNGTNTSGNNYTVAGGGTIGGTGAVVLASPRSISLTGGAPSTLATLSPGDPDVNSGIGTFTAGSSTSATTTVDFGVDSELLVQVDALLGADLLRTFGTVNLNDAKLTLSTTGSFTLGTTYTLIENDGTDGYTKGGTYTGLLVYNGDSLLNGDQFAVGATTFQINYDAEGAVTGVGNDVVLTVVPEPTVATSLAAGVVALLGRRRRGGIA